MATIPGADKFDAEEGLDEDAIAADLELHEPPEDHEVDEITFEVLRHRLWQINEEQGETLKRISGSPIVTDANDFNVTIADERGDVANFGTYVTVHAGVVDMLLKWTLEHRSENPGIREGDMFLSNDPWIGIAHQNDVSVVAPVFHDGELFAWTSSTLHQVDLGGTNPGSFCIDATDVYDEATPTPPIKIVENGEIRDDVEEMFLRRSRVPSQVGMDLRAQVAANDVARERLTDLIEQYGANTVKAVMKRSMDHAEEMLRQRLDDLPDGVWRHVDYQEVSRTGDRSVYRADMELRKSGDSLVFEVDADPQTGMINCAYPTLRGSIWSVILPLLCHDIPWALGGIDRVIEIEATEGTIVNATFPTGTSMGSTSGGWQSMNLALQCVSKMLGASEEYESDLIAGSSGVHANTVMMGADQRGDPFVTMLMDSMTSGWGGRSGMDGIDTAGEFLVPSGLAPNVELNELKFPILTLFREELTDSGGPGEYRGGVGAHSCLIPHDTDAPITHVLSTFGMAMPTGVGISGGYPPSTVRWEMIRDSNVHDLLEDGIVPGDQDAISGDRDVLPPKVQTQQRADEAFYCRWMGGGGFGDPLDRDPDRVAKDARNEYVSREEAERTYGVVLDDEFDVDEAATEARRGEIRDERLEADKWGDER
ncbi:hydantoinase B/oxoprolinase family protein [Saliphagus sp. GCM10025334]